MLQILSIALRTLREAMAGTRLREYALHAWLCAAREELRGERLRSWGVWFLPSVLSRIGFLFIYVMFTSVFMEACLLHMACVASGCFQHKVTEWGRDDWREAVVLTLQGCWEGGAGSLVWRSGRM